ncbi:two-component sensor histidine kinase [Flavobacterium album]|uniref:histidine kinase n=1 Tax=Flavobacterium album TaxID=2175091 RepID=A0A2S1R1M9_9FLAO|nr:HAMP domain-containing sensor histidine kinase [Flavobacterium album]AWH86545.1 two-component sensor histidine kinase [Flavobacterium album]
MKITSFKNRISLYNLFGVAILMLIIFISIYSTVFWSVNYDINEDLERELKIHQSEVTASNGVISYMPEGEWKEPEHVTVFMDPVFVEIYDVNKKLMEKSPNLKHSDLVLAEGAVKGTHIDTFIDSIPVRKVQTPLFYKGKTVGYAVIAMSIESETRVLDNLKYILFLTYPVGLIVLFFATRFIAARSIKPVVHIIDTARKITDNDFSQRIALPETKDELYILSDTINELLNRIENAIAREKQFTADASHELRTPLAIIKGTLEVLIRKPRDTDEYISKIKYCVEEVSRMNNLVDRLLMLARFENYDKASAFQQVALDEIMQEALERYSPKIKDKDIRVLFDVEQHFYILSDPSMLSIIIENVLSNAIKYSVDNGSLSIKIVNAGDGKIVCTITDNGIGIGEHDIDKVYDQFYRAEATENAGIKGTGLGLSIVRKIASLLHISIAISSIKDSGTTVTLIFNTPLQEKPE